MTASVRFGPSCALVILLGASAVVAQTPTVVRVLTVPTDTGAEAFYAQDKGFFARAGLNVEVTTMNNAGIAAALASGSYDIAESNVATVAAAHEHGQPFVMIAPSSMYSIKLRPTAGIVVAKNSPIKTARDFNGKTVAVSGLQTIGQISVQQWIDKNGGDSSTVKFVEMPFPAMIAAIDLGRVDATELAEPILDEALAHGQRSLGPGYDAVADEFVIGAWICTSTYAAAHPDIVRRFADVMAETARWANTHQAESGQILAKWTKTQVAPTMPRVPYGERLNAALVQPIIDVTAKYHALRASIPAKDLLAPGFGDK